MRKRLSTIAKKIAYRFYPPAHIVYFLQRTVLHPARRDRFARWFASRLPKSTISVRTEQQLNMARDLKQEGCVHIHDLVSPSQVGDILSFLETKPCYDRWRPDNGYFRISEAPSDCHVAPYPDAEVVRCPHLLSFANHPDILAAVEELFGCKPTLSQLSVWWSLPGHIQPEEAEFFHRDVDEWHFIKLFVYLTDVDEGSGPHVFVKGSPAIPKLLPIKRYNDCDVQREFGLEKVVHFTGKAGTAFLENTFGLHKGQMPTTNKRLLFQAQYSLFPIGIYKYSPSSRGIAHSCLDPYVNRLYLQRTEANYRKDDNRGQSAR